MIDQDDRAGGLYQLIKGQCEIRRNGKAIGQLGKDETCGEISYLGRTVSPGITHNSFISFSLVFVQ